MFFIATSVDLFFFLPRRHRKHFKPHQTHRTLDFMRSSLVLHRNFKEDSAPHRAQAALNVARTALKTVLDQLPRQLARVHSVVDALAAGGFNVGASLTAAHSSSDIEWSALVNAVSAANGSLKDMQATLRASYLHRVGELRKKSKNLSGPDSAASLRLRVSLNSGVGAVKVWTDVMASLQDNNTPRVTPLASNTQLLAMLAQLQEASGSIRISVHQQFLVAPLREIHHNCASSPLRIVLDLDSLTNRSVTLVGFNHTDVRQARLLLDALKSIAPIIVLEQIVLDNSADRNSSTRTKFVVMDAHRDDAVSSIVIHALLEPDEPEASATDSSARLRVGAASSRAPPPLSDAQQQRKAPSAGGKFPLHERFPRMVELLRTFIDSHGRVDAQERRRATVSLSTGVSLEQCRQHLLTSMPELKDAGLKLTLGTIQRLLKPPRANTVAAKNYHGVVDARIKPRDNSLSKSHPDAHFASAQLGLLKELAVFTDEIDVYSNDDKVHRNFNFCAHRGIAFNSYCSGIIFDAQAKVPVGRVMATFKRLTFYMTTFDNPTPDHDFAVARYGAHLLCQLHIDIV